MTKKPLHLAIAALLLSGSTIAHSATVPNNVTLADEQHLVRGNATEPTSIDPSFVNAGVAADVIANDIFEGFVIENTLGQIIPAQAKDWRFSNGGKTITFELRDNIKWSNGSPVSASDFVYAWHRAVNPTTGNNTSHYFVTANILNADLIIKGDKPVESLGIKAIGDKTVEITLEKPTSYFLSLMSVKTFFPLPQAVIEQHGEQWTRVENIATNGAYTLDSWVPNEYVEVVRNEHYWDNAATVINKVTYLGLSSQNAELIRYQAGEIDMTNRVQLEYYQKLKREDSRQIKSQPLLGSYVYSFNTTQAPFDDPRVRKALNMSVLRDILVDKVTGQGEEAAFNVVPNTIPNYEAPTADFKDLSNTEKMAQAKQLLNEAGYNKDNPLKFKLTYNTSDNHKKIALAIASMWKPLGVKVELENMEWKAYVAAKSSGDYQLARSWSFGDYPEPSAQLHTFTCGHTANESGYCNKEFDELLTQAGSTADQKQRYDLYTQAETLLNDANVVIPLYHYNHTRLVRTTLKGFPENNPKGNIYAKDLYFIAD